MAYLLIAAATFGVMFLLDKGLTKLFRSQSQHHSGTAVRLKKGYGIGSVALCILALLCLGNYLTASDSLMLLGFLVLLPMGLWLGAYYLAHGIFYDDDTFLFSTLGKKGRVYRYADIKAQKLYLIQGGSYLVELYMTDGSTVPVQTSMEGAYDFLDKACHARFRQLMINSFECDWFDEGNSCWFPPVEE